MTFRGKDAAIVIDIIDKVGLSRPFISTITTHSACFPSTLKVLKECRVPDGTRSHAFKMLRKLAGASRQVPKSYLVGMLMRYKVKNEVIASGGSADIREGRLRGNIRKNSISDRSGTGCKYPCFTLNRIYNAQVRTLRGIYQEIQ